MAEVARFILRLMVAFLGDWFCHKLHPRWKLDRAQKRLAVRIDVSVQGATKALDEFTQILRRIAAQFAEFEKGTNG